MHIVIGADHRGFSLKQHLLPELAALGHTSQDLGAFQEEAGDDYSVYAEAVVAAIKNGGVQLGVLICGSGEGMAMEANRTAGIRAAVVWRPEVAATSRQHNDANILVLPADFISEEVARECLATFTSTHFSGEERYRRRILAMDQNPHTHTS